MLLADNSFPLGIFFLPSIWFDRTRHGIQNELEMVRLKNSIGFTFAKYKHTSHLYLPELSLSNLQQYLYVQEKCIWFIPPKDWFCLWVMSNLKSFKGSIHQRALPCFTTFTLQECIEPTHVDQVPLDKSSFHEDFRVSDDFLCPACFKLSLLSFHTLDMWILEYF